MRRWLLIACLATSAGWGLGRILGERGLAASLLFYLPAPLVLLALALSAFLLRRSRRLWLPIAALAALPLLVLVQEQRWTKPALPAAPAGLPLSLLHWNVCRGYGGWQRIAAEIAAAQPDLAILSEVMTPADGETLARLLPLLPHKQYAEPMLVLSRHPLEPIQTLENGDGIRLYGLALDQDGAPWKFFALDVVGNPEISREPPLARLAARTRERQPDFMAGDFNTPRTSRLLSPLAPGYRHGYDLAGRGWSYTWPVFLPVLSLDHLYVRAAAVEVRGYQIDSSPISDHRLQRAVLHRRRQGDNAGSPALSEPDRELNSRAENVAALREDP
jgi:endonuclease/exonuclease/phosphatase (EEP) superfamily protein YafD